MCEAVNAVESEMRTQAEVKKKWSDIGLTLLSQGWFDVLYK